MFRRKYKPDINLKPGNYLNFFEIDSSFLSAFKVVRLQMAKVPYENLATLWPNQEAHAVFYGGH